MSMIYNEYIYIYIYLYEIVSVVYRWLYGIDIYMYI